MDGREFYCLQCEARVPLFKEIIEHLIQTHDALELKFRRRDGRTIKTLNFKIIPEICREQGRTITINEGIETIHVSSAEEIPKDSPYKKVLKTLNIHNLDPNLPNEQYDGAESTEINELEDDKDMVMNELIALLPSVIKALSGCGKLEEFVAFHRLLNDKKFPLDNIAFLLFLDVVRWYSLENFTTSMRYSDEIKLFWRTGLQLFHGRFLRFMGGPKSKGQLVRSEVLPGNFVPAHSKVNFVVPDRRALVIEEKFIEESKPGIVHAMLDNITQHDPEQSATYKLCVDGKKINPTSKGEVNLWGHEDAPTYEEKQGRLHEELRHLNETLSGLEKLVEFGRHSIDNLDVEEREDMCSKCRSIVTILSNRIKDLRQLKVKKDIFLLKLMSKCEGGDWRNNVYSMIISSLRTSIYQIENAIEEALQCITHLCRQAAITGDALHLFTDNTMVSMQAQQNLVCLGHNNGPNEDSSLVKQRSDAWHSLRKTSLVTGSTITRAIGLDGLKKQKQFLAEKSGLNPPSTISDELQKMFDHGNLNEGNAVATFLSVFLPAFYPGIKFYEEGCYIENRNGKPVLIVSPDGSVRDQVDGTHVLFGVEIKCPYPGKTFTTPIHYLLPHYYVPQILSQMYSLKVDNLFFLSYSKESMAIHLAGFDNDLWNDIYAEIETVTDNQAPKKLSPVLSELRRKIEEYRKTRVHLVAEVSSKEAKPCEHSSDTTDKRIYHACDVQGTTEGHNANVVMRMQKACLRCCEVLKQCHKLCAQRASEVLVFLAGDLDRSYKPEIPHAFPVAYAFKGYSMKTDIMRKMIQEVLVALFLKGMYTPVVSYDGQWAKLAYQSANGTPLTILELQRQVYNEVKARSVSTLTKQIFQSGVVRDIDAGNVLDKIDYRVDSETGAITVGSKGTEQLFRTSKSTALLLKETDKKNKAHHTAMKDDERPDNIDIDIILSDISSQVVSTLDDEVVSSLKTISTNAEDISAHGSCSNEVGDFLSGSEVASVISDEPSEVTTNSSANVDAQDEVVTDQTHTTATCEMELVENVLNANDIHKMLLKLQSTSKWQNVSLNDFEDVMKDKVAMKSRLTKADLILCLETTKELGKNVKIPFCKSWNKQRLIDILHNALTSTSLSLDVSNGNRKRKKKTPETLGNICKKIIKTFPKSNLNVIVAEHEFADNVTKWRMHSPFTTPSAINDVDSVCWFSTPEYNHDTLSYIFSFLDVHHLITNCRIKVCKDGFPERNVKKGAWVAVARNNKSHVEDLVDKQSDAIARETFSKEVEACMRNLRYNNEADFCRLVREFYEAEDEPGICATERCRRRLRFRAWLLEGVDFRSFPPYGMHIRGIPNVMFQGFITNIERRIQLFPYVKSGMYNVRSLGSLEAENF